MKGNYIIQPKLNLKIANIHKWNKMRLTFKIQIQSFRLNFEIIVTIIILIKIVIFIIIKYCQLLLKKKKNIANYFKDIIDEDTHAPMFIVAQPIWTNLKQSFSIHIQPSSNLERNSNTSSLLISSYQTNKKKS